MRPQLRPPAPERGPFARPILRSIVVFAGALAAAVFCFETAAALEPGDPAPAFSLPFLAEEGGLRAPDCFAGSPVTVLLIWDRGCPHCLDLALCSSTLADSVVPLGASVLGIVLGPDDPLAIRDLLWERAVTIPQLWDRERVTASAYDLGIKHIGIFVIDRSGRIRTRFDDGIESLVDAVKPAVMDVIGQPAEIRAEGTPSFAPITGPRAAPAAGGPADWPSLHLEGRSRLSTTDRARTGDTGLYGELLENGALLLSRWDLRLTWKLSPRIVVEPWIRVSNESETVLTEGAEQLTNSHGSLSVRYEDPHVSAALGAYRLRLSPLTLERWDLDDLPPIGGGLGGNLCGCSGGALGLQQRSLEMVGPDYTFEGASASIRTTDWLARGWIAIPRLEQSGGLFGGEGTLESRYRRIVYGGSLDMGRRGAFGGTSDLPQPLGLRVGYLWLEDDKRTLDIPGAYRPQEVDERVGFVLASAGPWSGVSAEAEFAELRSNDKFDGHGRGFRGGLRAERQAGRFALWGRVHRLQIDPGFNPYYRALTYEENREGWRGAFGVRFLPFDGAAREWLGLTLYSRDLREVDSSAGAGGHPREWKTYGISLLGRPQRDLTTELSWVVVKEAQPVMSGGDTRTSGASFNARWEGLGTARPSVRLEAIRPESQGTDATIIWQTYVSVLILK